MTLSRELLPFPAPFPNAPCLRSAHNRSRGVRRRLHATGAWQQWANSGVSAINSLAGLGPSTSRDKTPLQLSRIVDANKDVGQPPSSLSPAGALRELCRESLPYLTEDAGPASFKPGLVALPELSQTACQSESALCSEHRDRLDGAGSTLLNSVDATQRALLDADLEKPYVDPAFRSPKVYGQFLSDLSKRGIICFKLNGKSYLGMFFVHKKDGKVRLIFDTRLTNCYFGPPPKVRLPTASALSGVECLPGQELFFAGGDIDTCFYRISAPEAARKYFTLPPVRARHVGDVCIDGAVIDPDTLVYPQLLVLPMGWSWTLWIAQCIHEEAGVRSGQNRDDDIIDREPVVPLDSHCVKHCKYVDNFLEMGHDPTTVHSAAHNLTETLNDQNLTVHEMFGPATTPPLQD